MAEAGYSLAAYNISPAQATSGYLPGVAAVERSLLGNKRYLNYAGRVYDAYEMKGIRYGCQGFPGAMMYWHAGGQKTATALCGGGVGDYYCSSADYGAHSCDAVGGPE